MKYYPPLGAEDENADYENCDPVNHKWEAAAELLVSAVDLSRL